MQGKNNTDQTQLTEALQMQRDSATCKKYEISQLKRLAIGE